MDLAIRRIGDSNMHFFESDTDSSVQIIFLPSGFNPELWRHQAKYFSRSFKTISFRPTVSNQSWEGEKECLEEILNRDDVNNAILVSHHFGNSIAQSLEYNENVVGVVTTGSRERFKKAPPKMLYRLISKLGCTEPKIVKKMFFSEFAKYRTVKKFVEEVEMPDYSVFKDYYDNYRIERPVKNAMVVHADKDRLSSKEFIRKLKPGPKVSTIKDAGSFCFYERPEEYNKALNDFIMVLEDFVEERELAEIKKENRSLKDFSKEKRRVRKKVTVEP